MNKIEDKLVDFTDTELAYLHKYQLETYLPETQNKINSYIFQNRRLTKNKLKDLMDKNEQRKPVTENCCPCCKSDKIRIEKVDWEIPLHKAGAEDEYAMLYEIDTGKSYKKDQITCNVCGYILYDPNNEKRPWYKKLTDYFFDSPIWELLGALMKT